MGRFKYLVDTEEGMISFRSKYNIPPHVGVRYVAQGGMTILMGTITRNFLRFFRLSPTQCAPNMFRVLGSIEVLNERMNLNLTHHDVN